MAVATVIDYPDGTLDQYDETIAKMGFTREGTGGPGSLFHWAAKTDNGIRVTTVWRTREEFDTFAEAKIRPITADTGLGPPQITFYEVHNYLTAG